MSVASPEKLRLVLKLLSMSNAGLAAELGVDKSVVSRWLSGAVRPSSHNLSLLTQVVANRRPGFHTLDWERDPQGLAELFGVEGDAPRSRPHGRTATGLDLVIHDQAVSTTAQRGRAYEGFYRILRPADSPEKGLAYDYSIIRMADNGLMRMTLASVGAFAEGWLLPLHNQLYGVLTDATSGGMTFSILNGLSSIKVQTLDGVGLGASQVAGRTPTAFGLYCERIGDLTGDAEEDERRFLQWARESPQPDLAALDPTLLAHLFPNFGPTLAAQGGDLVLQIKRATSRSSSASHREQVEAGFAHPATAAEAPPAATAFAEQLRLVLKVLSLSSAQMAAAVEVDKSVVSRWLSGVVEPSAHNMARLTAVVAVRAPGFTTLDWERSPESLVQRLGADPAAIPALRQRAEGVLPLNLWDQILTTSALRGKAYEGFFRVTRPSLLERGGFIVEYGIVAPHPSGLWRFRLGSFGAMLEGWMLPLHDQINFVGADIASGVLMFGIFNGVGAAQVDAVDGLILSPSLDAGRSPTAMAAISEHLEDLSGDAEKDERRFAELIERRQIVPPEEIDEAIQRRLLRDAGPTFFRAGGTLLLQMPIEGTLARARGFRPR